jgi:peroxiredoxin Q/BCP
MVDLKIGDLAPDSLIQISEDNQYYLSSLKGKNIVLYFYPKDNTPGCSIEAKGFQDLEDEFKKIDTVVIGVSKDSLESHEKFKNKYNLQFDLASDHDTTISKSYNTLATKSIFGKKYLGINRTTFFINRGGYIGNIWENVSVFGHAKDVLEFIKKYENNK